MTFNSRPHEEVDDAEWEADCVKECFQLTTSRGGRLVSNRQKIYPLPFNSRPHEEVDDDESIKNALEAVFQLTTSRGGRLATTVEGEDSEEAFNSRPHEEVDATARVYVLFPESFQLTTSRGGRPLYYNVHIENRTFQLTTSRGGRLPTLFANEARLELSTHDLTRRST